MPASLSKLQSPQKGGAKARPFKRPASSLGQDFAAWAAAAGRMPDKKPVRQTQDAPSSSMASSAAPDKKVEKSDISDFSDFFKDFLVVTADGEIATEEGKVSCHGVNQAEAEDYNSDIDKETLIMGEATPPPDPSLAASEAAEAAADAPVPAGSQPQLDLAAPVAGSAAPRGRQTNLSHFFETGRKADGSIQQSSRLCCSSFCCLRGYEPPLGPRSALAVPVRSLADSMAWANDNVSMLEQILPEGALSYLSDSLATCTYSTAFSGIDCPGTAMEVLKAELYERLGRQPATQKQPLHLSAMEIYGPSQKELLRHPTPPRHIYKNVEDFWSVRSMDRIIASEEGDRDCNWWLETLRADQSAMSTAPCLRHHYCNYYRAHLHVAGIICVNWSPMGKQAGSQGRDFPAFAAWAALRRRMKEPIVLWECSDRYDPDIMTAALGDYYVLWTVKVQSTDFGLVAKRGRMYGIMLLREEVLARWGSLRNVIDLFHRQVQVSFDCIMVASKAQLDRDLRWAMARPASQAKGLSWKQLCSKKNPHLEVLTKNELKYLRIYESEFPGAAYNLAQNPAQLSMKSTTDSAGYKVMFALLRSGGIIWYGDRFLCPEELALCQGIACDPKFSNPRTHRETPASTCSFSEPDAERSRTAFVGQIGNGMSVPVVGSMLCAIHLFTAMCATTDAEIRDAALAEALTLPGKYFLPRPSTSKDCKTKEADSMGSGSKNKKHVEPKRKAGAKSKVLKRPSAVKKR